MKTTRIIGLVLSLMLSITLKAQIKVTTGGNIAMGYTSAPPTNTKVHIVGNTLFTSSSSGYTSGAWIRGNNGLSAANTPDYTWRGDSLTGLFHPASSTICFTLANSEKMRLTSTGLGIGKTASYKVDAKGDINCDSIAYGYRINGKYVLSSRGISTGIFVGNGAGASMTSGANCTATGYQSLNANSTAANNSAFGYQALNLYTGANNSAFGQKALYSCSTGTPNDAFGSFALYSNQTGTHNCAFGDSTLYSNIGNANSAFGTLTLKKNTSGINNSGFGALSTYSNTTGTYNTGLGSAALYSNTTSSYNTAAGYAALYNSTGSSNTATGYKALFNNTTGANNTAAGYYAGQIYSGGSYDTYIGYGADGNTAGLQNAMALGYNAIVSGSNKVVVGSTAVTQIGAYISNWTNLSDSRFKTNVTENVKGLEFIKKLRPVTFKINTSQLDDYLIQNFPDSVKQSHKEGMDFTASSAMIHSGFIAQEVEQAALAVGYSNSIVATPSNEFDTYGLAYAEFVVPLVKAVQEQAATIDSLKEVVSNLQGNKLVNSGIPVDELKNEIEELRQQLNQCCSNPGRATLQSSTSSWLAQNKPNPFNTQTVIEYNVVEEGSASILIFDMNGKLLKTLSIKIPGKGSVTVNGSDLYAGMYYYSLVVNGKEIDTKKMILTE
jgi:hypothetical protein